MNKLFFKKTCIVFIMLAVIFNVGAMEDQRCDDFSEIMQSMFDTTGTEWSCSICREGALRSDSVRILACGHAFHPECIQGWADSSAGSHSCPICRAPDCSLKQHILAGLEVLISGSIDQMVTVLSREEYAQYNLFLKHISDLFKEMFAVVKPTGMRLSADELKPALVEILNASSSTDLCDDINVKVQKLIAYLKHLNMSKTISRAKAQALVAKIFAPIHPLAVVRMQTENTISFVKPLVILFRKKGFAGEADRLDDLLRHYHEFAAEHSGELFGSFQCYLSELLFNMVNFKRTGKKIYQDVVFYLLTTNQESSAQMEFLRKEVGLH